VRDGGGRQQREQLAATARNRNKNLVENTTTSEVALDFFCKIGAFWIFNFSSLQ
jgi:hypothetical protein